MDFVNSLEESRWALLADLHGVEFNNCSELYFKIYRELGVIDLSLTYDHTGWRYTREGLDDLLTALLELRKEMDK